MDDLLQRDLEAYLRRIGADGDFRPTLDALSRLQLAHATHIPFENLDILLSRPIRLDLESLVAKLVIAKRGGYCFEQNLLFSAVLRRLGFSVVQLAARVRAGTDRMLARTHMALLVKVNGMRCLVHVGFGADGLLLPVALENGRETRHYAWSYRMLETDGLWTLQMMQTETWVDQYVFSLEPQYRVDYELANYYTSTHPDSRFTRTLTAQLPSPEIRAALRDRELTLDDGTAITTTPIAEEDLLQVLADRFGLPFPPGTRFTTPHRE